MSTSKDNWKPEETRYFFQLYAEERRKGNKVGQQMNKVGKKNIMDAFELRFKKGFSDWKRDYKNKYDNSRKKYIRIRMLTQNRTGLGYDNMGRIDMSDDWWKERERECPGIRKTFCKEIDNMDMFEAEFGGVVFTGAEGWSAQHGEASLNSRVGGDIAEDEADSQPAAETETQGQAPRQTQPAAQTHSGGSSSSPNSKRRRKHPKYGLVKWIKLVTATMALHNFIRDSHREDHDFVQWQNGDDGEGEADSDGDEEEGDDDDDDEKDDGGGGGGRIVYEPTGDRAMEDLRDNITNEYGRGRLPY